MLLTQQSDNLSVKRMYNSHNMQLIHHTRAEDMKGTGLKKRQKVKLTTLREEQQEEVEKKMAEYLYVP